MSEQSKEDQIHIPELGFPVPEDIASPREAFARVVSAFHKVGAVAIGETRIPQGFSPPEGFTPTHARVMDNAILTGGGAVANCVSFLRDPDALPEATIITIKGVQIPDGPVLDMEINRTTEIDKSSTRSLPKVERFLNQARGVYAPLAILGIKEIPPELDPHLTGIVDSDDPDMIGYIYSIAGDLTAVYNPLSNIMDASGRQIGRKFTETVLSGGSSGTVTALLEGQTIVSAIPRVGH